MFIYTVNNLDTRLVLIKTIYRLTLCKEYNLCSCGRSMSRLLLIFAEHTWHTHFVKVEYWQSGNKACLISSEREPCITVFTISFDLCN